MKAKVEISDMVKEVLTYPNKTLKEISKDVKKFDEKLHILLNDMYDTMMAKNGVGLAAIQIGTALNVLIINPLDEEKNQKKEDLIEVINPKIIFAEGEVIFNEGCLSVPSFYEDVKRAKVIEIEFFDRFGEKKVIKDDGFLAIAFQHEIDHLKGHLFIEKLSIIKRKKFEKEWKKKSKVKK